MSEIHATVYLNRPLAQCCDVTATRYALSNVRVTPRKHDGVYCTATNGKIAAIIHQDGIADSPQLLPAAFAKPPRKGDYRVSLNGQWTAETGMVRDNGEFAPDGKGSKLLPSEEGHFPKISAIIDDATPEHRVIVLDAKELKNLADAIGDGGRIALIVPPEHHRPIGALGLHGIGLIMPRHDSSDSAKYRTHEAANVIERFNESVAAYRDAERKAK